MADGYEIRNSSSGPAGNNAQIGVNHGNVWMTSSSGPLSVDVEQAARLRDLAGAVRSASDRELEKWGLRDRDALPVRWHTAAEELFDYWEKIQDSAVPVSLDGQFTAIRETYGAVESRRLVILGRAGAGKTVLAHRLILDLLKNSGIGPVPVLFSLSDWNPATELRCWLVEHLVRDFPFLDTQDATTGKKQAEVFVERGLILPVLDGFDEIHVDHHPAAIGRISTLDLPLIVTSRPDEYALAAYGIKAVGGAAAIAIEDLTRDETHEYLRHSTSKTRAPDWEAVFEHLRGAPDDTASQNLTAVLTTPLMVMLARTVYNDARGQHPGELLNPERFPTTAALEDHLLAAYLDTVYARRDTGPRNARRPNWKPDQARRWLGYLATHLQDRNTHDLTWWQLPGTLHRRTRILATTATVGVAGVLAILLAVGIATRVRTAAGLEVGTVVVFVVGLAVGLINEVDFSRGRTGPERLRLNPQRRDSAQYSMRHRKKSPSEFTSGLVVGLAGALGVVLGGVLGFDVEIDPGFVQLLMELLVVGLAVGLVVGIGFGFGNVIVSVLGDTYDSNATNPWTLLTRDRTVTLVRMTMIVPIVAFAAWLVFKFPVESVPGLPGGFAGRLAGSFAGSFAGGLLFGFLSGIARLMFSPWGSWLLFARLWMPLTGRLPWNPKRFLEDANARGVLRTTGATYQFRHARLRDYLADDYRT